MVGASQGHTRKKHDPLPLAGVAVPLIDFQRALITGSLTLDMWPSEELQKARDPKIKQDEVDPSPLILETQPVGENPEKTGGRAG